MHWTTWLYIGMFGLVGAFWGMQDAHAAEKDPPGPEQIQSLYMLAVGHAGIGVPEKAPRVYRVSNKTLCVLANRPENCRVLGIQAADAVFYSEELDFTKAFDSSILLHEFVHYLQWSKSGNIKSQFEQRARECQAYKVQAEVLGKLNIYFLPPAEFCDE